LIPNNGIGNAPVIAFRQRNLEGEYVQHKRPQRAHQIWLQSQKGLMTLLAVVLNNMNEHFTSAASIFSSRGIRSLPNGKTPPPSPAK